MIAWNVHPSQVQICSDLLLPLFFRLLFRRERFLLHYLDSVSSCYLADPSSISYSFWHFSLQSLLWLDLFLYQTLNWKCVCVCVCVLALPSQNTRKFLPLMPDFSREISPYIDTVVPVANPLDAASNPTVMHKLSLLMKVTGCLFIVMSVLSFLALKLYNLYSIWLF